MTQVGTGEVLASVTYPSYDNNELVNTFNNAYYNDLLQDGNTPLVNRPLKQKKGIRLHLQDDYRAGRSGNRHDHAEHDHRG